MKHRVLLKRAMAFVLTVTMLTSMCTTGYAADVGGSMEVQGTDGTSGAGMLYDSDEDEGVRRGGDSEAQDDQKSEAQDNENDKKKVNDNTDEVTGKNSDGQDEKAGEAEDTSGKESGKNQGGDSDNQKPSQGDSGDTTEDADGNSGDESKNQGGNSGDKNQAPEEGSDDQTQTSGSNSDDKSQDSGANQGDPKDTDGSTDSADTNQGNNQGTVSNQETDSNGSLNDKKNPNKTQNNTGANTDKTQDGKDEERVIVSPEEFLTEYEAFLEKYKADQENISKGKKPVEFKTWKEVKAPIARILDMADSLEDPDPMEEQIQELKEIFTNEGSKEFVRLVVRLMNDLINGEDEEDEELLENEDLEAIILEGPANEFSQLIDELIQDMSEKSAKEEAGQDEEANQGEAGKTGSLDDSLGTEADGAGADEDAEERGQAALAENADSDGNFDGQDVLGSADKVAKTENDTKTEENAGDEELDEELTSGPVAEFFQDVNNLIYDMVVVLADEETALSGKELREALSKSRVIADFVLGVSGVLQDLKDGMDLALVNDLPEDPEKKAIEDFLSKLETITDDLLEGKYATDQEGLENLLIIETIGLEDSLREIDSKLPSDYQELINGANGFFVFITEYNMNIKTDSESISEWILEQRQDGLKAIKNVVDKTEKNKDWSLEAARNIIGLYEKDLNEVIADIFENEDVNKAKEELQAQIKALYDRAMAEAKSFDDFVLGISKPDEMDSFLNGLKDNLNKIKQEQLEITIPNEWPGIHKRDIQSELTELSNKITHIESKINELIEKRTEFIGRFNVLKEEVEIFTGEKEGASEKDWTMLSGRLTGLFQDTEGIEASAHIFSEKEFSEWRESLGALLVKVAEKELQNRIEKVENEYSGKTLSDIGKEIIAVNAFLNDNLPKLEENKRAGYLKRLQIVTSKKWANTFLETAETLKEAAETAKNSSFQKYTKVTVDDEGNNISVDYEGEKGYNEFVKDIRDAEAWLGGRVIADLKDDIKLGEEGVTEGAEILSQVEVAREELYQYQMEYLETVNPETKAALDFFNKKYARFMGDYEIYVKEKDEENKTILWKWNTILTQITDILKLTNRIPWELCAEKRSKLETILSDEALKEFNRICKELFKTEQPDMEQPDTEQSNTASVELDNILARIPAESEAWLEGLEEEIKESLKPIVQKVNSAKELIGYIIGDARKKEFLLKLESIEQKIKLIEELMESKGERSQKVRDFIDQANQFVKKAEEGGFVKDGEILVYELRLENDNLEALYNALNQAEQGLSDVKEAKNAWTELYKNYQKEIDQMNDGLYEFLKEVDKLCKYFKEVQEIYSSGTVEDEEKRVDYWNLKLAYEACENRKADLLNPPKDTDPSVILEIKENKEFIAAGKKLAEVKKWLEEVERNTEIVLGEDPVGGTYAVGQAISVGASLSVPEVTMHNAEEFILLIQEMESALNEQHKISQNMRERVVQYCNSGSLSQDEKASIEDEMRGFVREIDRAAKEANYDNWHGLVGGTAYAEIAWRKEKEEETNKVYNPMIIEIESRTAKGLGIDYFLKPIEQWDKNEILEIVDNAIDQIAETRSELGARQNLSEDVVNVMATWLENEEGATTSVEELNWKPEKEYDSIKENTEHPVIDDSLTNAERMITNIQIFEGTLNESHSMLHRINELVIKRDNEENNYNEQDRRSINREIVALTEGLTFFAQYVNYDGWNGLRGGTLNVPMGWHWHKDFQESESFGNHIECHPINIPIDPMTADGLGLGLKSSENPEMKKTEVANGFDEADILTAMEKISLMRSRLGAWQNTGEHIEELCQGILDRGPLIGNRFERYGNEKDGTWSLGDAIQYEWNWYDAKYNHKILERTGLFDQVLSGMEKRIAELEIQKQNETLNPTDIASIEEEMKQLNYGVNVLIDLVKTDMATEPYVRLEEDFYLDWYNKVYITKNEQEYRYKLEYKSYASETTEVCLIDHVEVETDENGNVKTNEKGEEIITSYAGTITGVDLSGVKDKEGNPISTQVYVQTRGIPSSPSSDLPETLKKTEGSWELIPAEELDTYQNWKYVKSIAFYFGEHTFAIDDPGISVEIKMASIYGGNPNWNTIPELQEGEGYTLYNTCTVYQCTGGDNEKKIEEKPATTKTEVIIQYDEEPDLPVQLPTTGGSGTLPFRIAGLAFLVLAETMMFFKKEEDDEMLRGIRG